MYLSNPARRCSRGQARPALASARRPGLGRLPGSAHGRGTLPRRPQPLARQEARLGGARPRVQHGRAAPTASPTRLRRLPRPALRPQRRGCVASTARGHCPVARARGTSGARMLPRRLGRRPRRTSASAVPSSVLARGHGASALTRLGDQASGRAHPILTRVAPWQGLRPPSLFTWAQTSQGLQATGANTVP